MDSVLSVSIVKFILLYSAVAKYNPTKVGQSGVEQLSDYTYPYVVRILEIYEQPKMFEDVFVSICTASVLTPEWSLTAAHCIYGAATLMKKTCISHFVKQQPKPMSEIKEVVYTPYYDAIRNQGKTSDLGLIRHTPFLIDSYIKVSAFNFKALNGQKAVLPGFGPQRVTRLNLKLIVAIEEVQIEKCPLPQVNFPPALCLIRPYGDVPQEKCYGDSGGPVLHASGLIGVITGEIPCTLTKNTTQKSGDFTATSPYIKWIRSYTS